MTMVLRDNVDCYFDTCDKTYLNRETEHSNVFDPKSHIMKLTSQPVVDPQQSLTH